MLDHIAHRKELNCLPGQLPVDMRRLFLSIILFRPVLSNANTIRFPKSFLISPDFLGETGCRLALDGLGVLLGPFEGEERGLEECLRILKRFMVRPRRRRYAALELFMSF